MSSSAVIRALLGLWVASGCAEPGPIALERVDIPPIVRAGTRADIWGQGLAGMRLQISGRQAYFAIEAVESLADGLQHAAVRLEDVDGLGEGEALPKLCLEPALPDVQPLQGWQACRAVQASFRRLWQLGPPLWTGTTQLVWGQAVRVGGADLPLPGEGQAWLEARRGMDARTAVVVTRPDWGRGLAELEADFGWLGPEPGPRQVQLRWRVVPAPMPQGQRDRVEPPSAPVVGPWGPVIVLGVAEPRLTVLPVPTGRGEPAPLRAMDAGSHWSLRWAGVWSHDDLPQQLWPQDAARRLMGQPGSLAVTLSPWWLKELGQVDPQGWRFSGQVQLQVGVPPDVWEGPVAGLLWTVAPTRQRIALVATEGWAEALARFGLWRGRDAVEAMIRAHLIKWFAGLRVDVAVGGPSGWPGEVLRLDLGGADPSGLGLLGADNSLGKDVGNHVLGEHLGGFSPAVWSAGQVAWGGVFALEFMGFSPALHPEHAASAPAFDILFGPWLVELGGRAASVAEVHPGGAARPAMEALASLVAETCAHEIGHALGLAAQTTDAHHAQDHPGWIMDSGQSRPFAERASLPGAVPPQWGPVDSAYLKEILGGGPP